MSGVLAFAREELRLDLTPAQAEMLATFEASGAGQAVWQCGRRGGKSLLADVLALYDATVRDWLRAKLRPGELRVAAIVAPRIEQAADHIRNCAALIEASPRLRSQVVASTTEEIVFANGSAIRAYPCSARSIRGGAWSSVDLDELAHFVDSTDGPAAGDRILEAALPALAQFGSEGWLIAISTPRWRQGAFWKLVERAKAGAGRYHFRHLTTAAMNPRIPAEWLEERRREDPDLYAREFEAEFVDGTGSWLSSGDVVRACRREGILPPGDGPRYVAAIDPADYRDKFTLAIAHRADDSRIVVDGVWAWHRLGHAGTLNEVAAIALRYGVRSVSTDQHSAEAIREGLRERGLRDEYLPWTAKSKFDAFTSLKLGLQTGAVELPNDPAVVEELCGLESRPAGEFVRIAAAPGGHDDRATVIAAVVHALTGRRRRGLAAVASDGPSLAFQPGWRVLR